MRLALVVFWTVITVFGFWSYSTGRLSDWFAHNFGGYHVDDNGVHWAEWYQGFYLEWPRHKIINIENADVLSFTVLEHSNYARDKFRGYYRGRAFEAKDPLSLRATAPHFAADNITAYRFGKQIEGAHGPTHKVLNRDFSRDKNDIYFEGTALGACDPESARLLSGNRNWVIDNKCAYYSRLKKFPIKDSNTFTIYDSGSPYAKDRYAVYYHGKEIAADPDSFRFMGQGLFRDNTNIYWRGSSVESVDADSFSYFGAGLFADNQAVYDDLKHHYFRPVPGADPSTAVVLESSYWRDDDQVFHKSVEMVGVDIESFVALNPYYARDRFHVFRSSNTLEGADPATFEVYGTIGKDKNGCWTNYTFRASPFACEIVRHRNGFEARSTE